jgi:hypothetical protein
MGNTEEQCADPPPHSMDGADGTWGKVFYLLLSGRDDLERIKFMGSPPHLQCPFQDFNGPSRPLWDLHGSLKSNLGKSMEPSKPTSGPLLALKANFGNP